MLVPSAAPLPGPNPTTSYWMKPFSNLRKHRSTGELPKEVDFVVIGGGLSGSSLAYCFLEKIPGAKVLLLEARDTCSGASGRNGGHCRPGRYLTFVRDTELHGPSEAAAIARFEEANVRQVAEFVKKHEIDCLLESVTTVDLFESGTEALFTDGLAAVAARRIALAEDIASSKADERTIHTASEARDQFQTPDAIGAISFPAYSINPYRFVSGILHLALRKGLNLQTSTPVNAIEQHNSHWTVTTSRGVIKAPTVILATNAYTSHLLPQASRWIMPVRNQAVAVREGSKIARTPLLKSHSICFNYSTSQPGVFGDDYMVSKPPNSSEPASVSQTRDLILGGGRHLASNHEEYNTDDSIINADISAYLTSTLQTQHFGHENWGEAGATIAEWTGIVGHTHDENPILGPVPGKRGLFICAAFTGHGMALAFRSADAVSDAVLGRDRVDIPQSFLCGRKGCEVLGRCQIRDPGFSVLDGMAAASC